VNARLLVFVVLLAACRTPGEVPTASPEAVEVSFTAAAESPDERRLVLRLESSDALAGHVVALWPADAATSAPVRSETARLSLPDPHDLITTPPPRDPPPLSSLEIELRGTTQRGRATVDLGDDPAAVALRVAVAEAHSEGLATWRATWLESHRAETEPVVSEAVELADAAAALDFPIPRGRTTADVEALTALSARCLRVRPALERLQPRVRDLEDDLLGPLPGLPETLAGAAEIALRRRDLGWACEKVTRGLEAAGKRTATEAAATDARVRLKKRGRTKRALASVALVDEILRSAATDELFLEYEDALTDWGDAETKVLRLRKADPAESEAAMADAAEARRDVDAVNAMITLTLSGRSGQLSDAVFAAAKRLERLKEEEREAVLDLFVPELTPASRVLQQLVRDRL